MNYLFKITLVIIYINFGFGFSDRNFSSVSLKILKSMPKFF